MKALALRVILILTAFVLVFARAGAAQSDLVIPADQYTSQTAKRLAATHAAALRDVAGTLYHCLPWLEVHRHSIGFFKPKHASNDDRYLSVRVFVEQEPSDSFVALGAEGRAGAMFSRYVGHLLRRMARNRALVGDADLAGFTVIVEWVKQGAQINGRPVHETIAAFVPKPLALEYLTRRVGAADLARRSRVLGFDGETALGEITVRAYDDDFATTYKVANYDTPAGVDCR
jgi:hypothetical protein